MRVAVVPGTLALLPQYAGLTDPIAELRLACQEAVAWLVEDGPTAVKVLGSLRIAEALLPGFELGSEGDVVLVVANGSARRGEKAPGHLDERAFAFDEALGAALTDGTPAALEAIDESLADELLAAGIPALKSLANLGTVEAKTWYDADPFGVQYWVVTWSCES
jgi:hypothetical protein